MSGEMLHWRVFINLNKRLTTLWDRPIVHYFASPMLAAITGCSGLLLSLVVSLTLLLT